MATSPKSFSGKTLPPHLDKWRVICLYGDDTGLISERAKSVVKEVVGAADDPFRVVTLNKEDQDRLQSEYTAISMMGGQRVIRVREVGDDIRKKVEAALKCPSDNILVLQTQNIVSPSRSSLCKFLSKQEGCALVKCYKETGNYLGSTIRRMAASQGVKITPDALQYILRHIDADNSIIKNEIEKTLLYVYPKKEITLEDAQVCIGDSGVGRMDDIAYSALNGDVQNLITALGRAYLSGQTSIGIIRTVLNYMQRLRRMKIRQQNGEQIASLVRSIHFMRRPIVTKTLQYWSIETLSQAIHRMQSLEMSCKKTGAPDEELCRQHLLLLAQRV